jgi:hypothetical protein
MPMIPRPTRYRALPDSAYDSRVTDLSAPLNAPPGAGAFSPGTGNIAPGDAASVENRRSYFNRNVTNTLSVQLAANKSLRLLPFNDRRSGLIVQNKDATAGLNYSFSNDLGFAGLLIAAGGSILLDFTTPPDTLYLISTANILVVVVEITRRG